jgi:TRAP-type C4-dicarboxylate transport system substrate-binding protein
MEAIGMKLQKVVAVLGALALMAGFGFARDAHAAEQTIKIGTLAPKSSPWGKVFEVWVKAVNEKSGGKMELQFFYNGQQGDEDAMVGKIKSGQLDGAAVTAVGLSKVYKPILALQMPLFTSWSKLDKARDAMKADFEKGAKDAGFFLAGWGDVGLARTMSKGFAIKVPDDLKGKKPYYIRADVIQPAIYSIISGVSGVPLNVPEVLPNLNTGAINVITAPCLAAEQLQWAGKLDNINENVVATAIGALVFSQKRVDGLPADLKTILTDTGKVAASALTTKIRSEDDAAFGRLKAKMTVTSLNSDQKSAWERVFRAARQKLAQGTFSSDLVTKLEGYAK